MVFYAIKSFYCINSHAIKFFFFVFFLFQFRFEWKRALAWAYVNRKKNILQCSGRGYIEIVPEFSNIIFHLICNINYYSLAFNSVFSLSLCWYNRITRMNKFDWNLIRKNLYKNFTQTQLCSEWAKHDQTYRNVDTNCVALQPQNYYSHRKVRLQKWIPSAE